MVASPEAAPAASPAGSCFFSSATGTAGGAAGAPPSFFSFAFFLILTRSTMRMLHAMLTRRGGDARGLDGLFILAERVEQRSRRERVDHARHSATQLMNLLHRLIAERIA